MSTPFKPSPVAKAIAITGASQTLQVHTAGVAKPVRLHNDSAQTIWVRTVADAGGAVARAINDPALGLSIAASAIEVLTVERSGWIAVIAAGAGGTLNTCEGEGI